MKILTVYNIAGISGKDNTNFYIQSLNSLYCQKDIEQKIVVSSCLNEDNVLLNLKQYFKDLEIIRYKHKFTVNMTFNKTVKIMIEKYGKFDAYLYVDSGVVFNDSLALYKGMQTFKSNKYAMAAYQTNTDTGYQYFGPEYKLDSEMPQITNKDKIVPFGYGINLHAQFFCHEIYEKYNNILPDVFVAYCTESTFPFVSASLARKMAIIKDILLIHKRSIDGASSGQEHRSKKFMNYWNNLFGTRDANTFIKDQESIDAGLGYEECNNIMIHNRDAYIDDYMPKNPALLAKKIKEHFYLSEKEFNYNKMPYDDIFL